MNTYRFYYLDKLDHIIKALDFQGVDDRAAVKCASSLTRTHAIEIWQEKRLVGRLEKGTSTLAA